MALTRELLVANAALAGLTEEQITAITTLSANDENSVIAKKTGEIYGALDKDILDVSGVAKNGTEKTYDYAKRVLGDFKAKADGAAGLQTQIDTLTKEKAKLEKAIAEGSADEETKKALRQAKADLASVTTQFTELNKKYEDAKAAHEKELFGIKINGELQAASSGIKFKPTLPEAVTKVLMQQATEKLMTMNPEYIDNGNGGKVLVFKDATGAIMRNPNNQLNPYTPAELLSKELGDMDVLDVQRQQTGGGTQPPQGGQGGGGTVISVAGAKNQQEAYDAIKTTLMAQGLTVGSVEFQNAMDAAWKDNNISALPIQ